jgi:V-type H+-transporting ATPase subunit H
VDKQPKAKVESLLLSDGQAYAHLYLRLLNKLQRVDTHHWILVMIADMLSGEFSLRVWKLYTSHPCKDHEERIALFTRAAESDPDLPYGPLLR